MQKIRPFLWFDTNAEDAVDFYVSVFPDAEKGAVSRYGEAGPGPAGEAMVVEFTLFGTEFLAMNGGSLFTFNEAVSFLVGCETQEEIDHYWNALSKGGETSRSGWLKDPFGLSWQVVPTVLDRLMVGDAAGTARVMTAMMAMEKLDVAALEAAYAGG